MSKPKPNAFEIGAFNDVCDHVRDEALNVAARKRGMSGNQIKADVIERGMPIFDALHEQTKDLPEDIRVLYQTAILVALGFAGVMNHLGVDVEDI